MSVAIQFIELEVNILNILKLFSAHDKWSKWVKNNENEIFIFAFRSAGKMNI
jgi:hypothetical protein